MRISATKVASVVPSDQLTGGHPRVAAQRLAKYKLPKIVEYRAELPRDHNGKLHKRTLRDADWAGAKAS